MRKARIVLTDEKYDLHLQDGTPVDIEVDIRGDRVWATMSTCWVDLDITAEVYEIKFVVDPHDNPFIEDTIVEQIKRMVSFPIPKIRFVSEDGETYSCRAYDGNTGEEINYWADMEICTTATKKVRASLTTYVPSVASISRILSKVGSDRVVLNGMVMYLKDRMEPRDGHEYCLVKAREEMFAAAKPV